MKRRSERGSAIIMLFIAVALFGMISYAFLQGSRSNVSMMTSEAQKAASAQSQDCANAADLGLRRLRTRGCTGMISTAADGSNSNPGAPSDGSCSLYHPKGGGVKPCTITTTPACTVPNIGDVCPDGAVYAGMSPDGNKRMYTTPSDFAQMTWNSGSGFGTTSTTGRTSTVTGAANSAAIAATDADIATPGLQQHMAASYCENLISAGKSDWYLPALDELLVLAAHKDDIGNFYPGNDHPNTMYWSSTELDAYAARSAHIVGGGVSDIDPKPYQLWVRCVRKD